MKKSVIVGVVLAVLYLAVFVLMACQWELRAALVGWLMSMMFAGLLAIGWDDGDPELILEPLSLEAAENLDVCWLEIRAGYYVEPCAVGSTGDFSKGKRPVYVIGYDIGNAPLYNDAEYGSYWRCWAEKPTEEDCKAAPWNDTKQEDNHGEI